MRIVSWNCYLAPLMPNRRERRQAVPKAIRDFADANVDVICLQECNDLFVGIFTHLITSFFNLIGIDLYRLWIWELISVLEGAIWSLLGWKNGLVRISSKQELINVATEAGYKYVSYSDQYLNWLDGGLMILSKRPIYWPHEIRLQSDFYHPTSALQCQIGSYQIINAHFIPVYHNEGIISWIAAIANWIFGYVPKKINQFNWKRVIDQCRPDLSPVICGDFNIPLQCGPDGVNPIDPFKGQHRLYRHPLVGKFGEVQTCQHAIKESYLWTDVAFGQLDAFYSKEQLPTFRWEEVYQSDHHPIVTVV